MAVTRETPEGNPSGGANGLRESGQLTIENCQISIANSPIAPSPRRRERPVAEEQSDERDRFFALSLDLLCVIDFEGRFQRLNPAWERTLGFTIEELLAEPCQSFIHPEDWQPTVEAARKLAGDADLVSFENRYRCKDGSYRWLLWTAAPYLDPSANPTLIYAAARDITDRKQTEEALRQSEERFRRAAESASDLIYEWDIRADTLEWYGKAEEQLGYQPGEFPRTIEAWESIIHPEDRERVMAAVERHLQTRVPFREEYRVLRQDGAILHWTDHGSALWDEAGQPYKWIGVTSNITQRRLAEAALLAADDRLRRQNGALAELARSRTLNQGDLGEAVKEIVETAAGTLAVERVSVWRYDGAQSLICCADLYERSADRHTAGMELKGAGFPDYFQALEEERTIAAHDAHTDPRTREFSSAYLTPLGIGAMLDVPIRLRGQMVGVLCHEHVGPPREWTLDEQNFARSLADLISLGMEAAERKRAEAALLDSEERFRSLCAAAPIGIFQSDLEGRTTYCNSRWETISGFSPGDSLGYGWSQTLHPDDRGRVLAAWARALSEGVDFSVESRVVTSEGGLRWAHCRAVPTFSEDRRPTGYVGTIEDITERKRAQETLQAREKRFRALIEHSWDAVALVDGDGCYLYVSPSTQRILGYAPEEMIGRSSIELVHPEDRPYLTNMLGWLSTQPGGSVTHQCRFQQKDGSWRWLEGSVTNLLHEPSVQAIVTNHRDITENKRAEEILQTSERRFRALIEHSWDSVLLLSADGTCLYASPATARTLGYPPGELIGGQPLALIHPDDLPAVREFFERTLLSPGANLTIECRVRQKDGSLRWVEGSGTNLLHEPSVQAIVCHHRDITVSKRAQAELQENHALLSAVTEGTTDAVFVKDLQGRYLMINSAGAAFVGKSVEEVIGRDDQELLTPDTGLPMMERDCKIMESGVTQTYEEVATAAGITRTYLSTKGVYRDGEGQIIGLIGIARDITGRKLADEQLKEFAARLESSNRELQEFAYVASHDLQEPLRKIQAFGDRLRTRCGEALSDEGRDYLDRMQSAASRMRTLIHDLLSFSRVTTQAQPFVATDLNQVAAEVVSDLETRIEELGGVVEIGDLPRIDADPTQMRQLLQNLISNALKFHREGEPPVVRVHARLQIENCKLRIVNLPTPASPEPDTLVLSVSDNGIGFEEKYLDRIFTPFQRLHGRGEYEGTGIGLAICRKIVERHGGSITATSRLGHGSQFVILLPVKQPEGEVVSEQAAEVDHHSGG